MDSLFTFTISVFTGFFAIMNPIANTPVFMGLVAGYDEKTKKAIARRASITAFFITAAFVFLGKYIFEMFGITIPAFKITGGILIFYVGFEMLMSKKSKIHSNNHKEDNTSEEDIEDAYSIAVSPLAIPILSGPGTIVTAMNFSAKADFVQIGIIITVFALMIGLVYLAFSLSDKIVAKLGHNMILVIGKLMGLILAIIGTGMLIEGIKLAFNIS